MLLITSILIFMTYSVKEILYALRKKDKNK